MYFTDKELLLFTRGKNETRRSKSTRHEDKKRRIKKYIDQAQVHITKQQTNLQQCHVSSENVRRQHIKDLLEYIFSLEEMKPKRYETVHIDTDIVISVSLCI